MKLDKEQSKKNQLATNLQEITKCLKFVKLQIGGLCVGGAFTFVVGFDAFFNLLNFDSLRGINAIILLINVLTPIASAHLLNQIYKKCYEKEELKESLEMAKKETSEEISKIDMLDEQYTQLSHILKKGRV